MNIKRGLLAVAAIMFLTGAAASAQVVIQVRPNGAPPGQQFEGQMSDDEVIHAVFDPVTDALNLTAAQKFIIVTIASAAMNSSAPLFDQLDELDDQISIAAFSGTLDETKLKQLSARQSILLSQINLTLAHAKASFYKVLTPEQRAIILAQYRPNEESLGAISSVGP
jgi:hypothetical protein